MVLVDQHPRPGVARTGVTSRTLVDVSIAVTERAILIVTASNHCSSEPSVLLVLLTLAKAMSAMNVQLRTMRIADFPVDVGTRRQVAGSPSSR